MISGILILASAFASTDSNSLSTAIAVLIFGVGFLPLAAGLILRCLRDIAINSRASVLAIHELRESS